MAWRRECWRYCRSHTAKPWHRRCSATSRALLTLGAKATIASPTSVSRMPLCPHCKTPVKRRAAFSWLKDSWTLAVVPALSSKPSTPKTLTSTQSRKSTIPRHPAFRAGSGRTSGQWTRVLSVLGDLSAEAGEQLESFALRLLGASLSEGAAAAAAFGLLFIPSPNEISVEGAVADLPGVRYAWNRDESTLHLT